MAGQAVVKLVPNALKVNFPKSSMVLVSRAPKWDVEVFNASARTKFTRPLSKFTGFSRTGFAIAVGFYYSNIELSKCQKCTRYLDQDTNTYRASDRYLKEMRENLKRDNTMRGSARQATVLTGRAWPFPRQEGIILSRLYGLAEITEIPLKYEVVDQDAHKKIGLSTSAMSKTNIADSEFVLPTNLKPVSTMEAVQMDREGENGLQSLLDGIDSNTREHR